MTILFALFLLQTNSILSPTVVAVVTALFTAVVGYVGSQFLKDKINGNSRVKGFVAALVTVYGIITPFISSLPRGLGAVLAVLGLVVTLTSARLQGADDRAVDKNS